MLCNGRPVIDLINAAFDGYYTLLVVALVILVPVWIGRAMFEVAATILHYWRR